LLLNWKVILHSYVFLEREREGILELFRRWETVEMVRCQDEHEATAATSWLGGDDALDEINGSTVEKVDVADNNNKNAIFFDEAVDGLVSEVESLCDATVAEVLAASETEIGEFRIEMVREPICNR